MTGKTFSIVIPTIGRTLLDKTIDSVLSQSVLPDEIVVWDNSGSGLAKSQSKYKDNPLIHWSISEDKKDIISSWNCAVKSTTGDYIYILGDDDLLLPGFTKAVIDELNRGTELIHVPAQIIDPDDNIIGEEKNDLREKIEITDKEFVYDYLNKRMHIYLGSLVFPRAGYERVGKFKNIIMNALLMDILFHLEMVLLYKKITMFAKPVWQYRSLVSDWSGKLKSSKEITLLIKQSLSFREYLRKTSFSKYKSALSNFERTSIIAGISRVTYLFSSFHCFMLLFAKDFSMKDRFYVLRDILYLIRH